MMNLLPDERVLLESDNGEFILTTHRARFEAKRQGQAQVTSILLDQISSSEIRHASKPILLMFAFLFAITVIGGLLFLLAYLWSRRQVISLASYGATINLETRGMSLQAAKDFINDVESAKNARYLLNGPRQGEP